MANAAVQRLIADACLAGATDGIVARADTLGLSPEDAAVIAASPDRVALYRRLVRNNLLGVTAKMMPRTRARLNDLRGGAFDATFDVFLGDVGPRTHYLRDVPAEFLAWAGPRWMRDVTLPSYVADLAAHELVEFQIAAAPPLADAPSVADLALDRRVVFCPACRRATYRHAVHRLPEDPDDRTAPEAGDVALLVYRDPDNAVRFLELSPLAAAIADRLLSGGPLGEAIAAACAAQGTAPTADVLGSTARMLADWAERGVLLGAEPVPERGSPGDESP